MRIKRFQKCNKRWTLLQLSPASSASLLPGTPVPRLELWLFLLYPPDEFLHFRMLSEALYGMVMVVQFPLGKNRMDLGMANLVQSDLLFSFEGFRNQMVLVDGIPSDHFPSADLTRSDDLLFVLFPTHFSFESF